jgi:hypothetical protein
MNRRNLAQPSLVQQSLLHRRMTLRGRVRPSLTRRRLARPKMRHCGNSTLWPSN